MTWFGPRKSQSRTWLAGIVAGLAGLGAVEAVAAATRSRSPVDQAGQLVIDTAPLALVEQTVRILRTADKPVIRAVVIATTLAGNAFVWRLRPLTARTILGVAAAGVGSWLSSKDASAAGSSAEGHGSILAIAAGGLAALGVSSAPRAALGPAALAGGAGLAYGSLAQGRRRVRQDAVTSNRGLRLETALPPAVDGAEGWSGVVPLLTPLEDFYVTDASMRPPVVDIDRWRLRVTGMVEEPLSLSYEDLLAMPLVEFDATMVCVHNRLGWDRLGTARWVGVPLTALLDAAGVPPDGAFLVTGAVDGWECSLPLSTVRTQDGYVVLGMAGHRLTAAHGFPARVFFPGVYGQYSGAKWLTELRVQTSPNRDYWLPRGWPPGPMTVRPLSRIDAPTHRCTVTSGVVEIVGVAWAPPGGVAGVQIAVDTLPWVDVELADELAPAAWRRWRLCLPLSPGRHRVRVRCIAKDGTVQDETPRTPYPSGVSGYHTIDLDVGR